MSRIIAIAAWSVNEMKCDIRQAAHQSSLHEIERATNCRLNMK